MIKKYVFSWYTVCFYTVVIIVASVIPLSLPLSSEIDFFDKVIHFVVYLSLSFLVLNTALLHKLKHYRLISFLTAFTLGLSIEFVQFFLPFRNFEALDIGVNFLGALVGVFLRIVK